MKTTKNKTTKSAKSKSSKFIDIRGLDTKKNYSSFWMDNKWSKTDMFQGLGDTAEVSSDIVKLVKLTNYRKAISNFVKIVTNKDIPVTWSGSNSYTDGSSINITTDIKDTNFDVTVGLALHEASHVILSDFKLATTVSKGSHPSTASLTHGDRQLLFNLLNWIEDRRIDNFIFSTSPGYKAYYHKLYDHYWNSNNIHKGFASKEFCNPADPESWLFHIINMLNLRFNPNAMPGLSDIVAAVDLPNIGRLKSTEDALDVACKVFDIMKSYIDSAKQQQQSDDCNSGGEGDNNSEETQAAASTPQINQSGSSNSEGEDSSEGEDGDTQDTDNELSASEISKIKSDFLKQKNFLDGKTQKKSATKSLQKQLDSISNCDIDVQVVGGTDGIAATTCIVYNVAKDPKAMEFAQACIKRAELQVKHDGIVANSDRSSMDKSAINASVRSLTDLIYESPYHKIFVGQHNRVQKENLEFIQKGIEMGGLLGKKLQLHNESRERVDNRLRSGKIDNKRLAHAGYGIEGVFKQISIDRHKKANLHISLDGSGSMSGSKWHSTLQMTVAIAKAVTYTQNIDLQISIRVTTNSSKGELPTVLSLYNSKYNKFNQLVDLLTVFKPTSMTPEGMCFEAMLNKNMFVSSTNEVDSYFLNLSDGEPNCGRYVGMRSITHTRSMVNKMKDTLKMSVLSFWIESSVRSVNGFEQSQNGINFKTMYGKDATVVACDNALSIARELNKKFLSH